MTKSEVAAEYPSYLTLDRSTFTLRLWEDLKLAKTYTVAVGMEGLETPEGLYAIQEKEENPTWHVPDSDWAGVARRARRSRRARRTRSRRAGWRSTKAPASTAPKRPTRSAAPPPTAACAWRSPTSKNSTTGSKSGRRSTSASGRCKPAHLGSVVRAAVRRTRRVQSRTNSAS